MGFNEAVAAEEERYYFYDEMFASSKRRLSAVIYEVPDSVELGAGSIRLEYTDANGKPVVTPSRCSLGENWPEERFPLKQGESIQRVEKVFFQTAKGVLLELTITTNQNRTLQIGFHNRCPIVESEVLAAPDGYEIFAFQGCHNGKNLLDLEIALQKRTEEYLFNDLQAVQGNGPLKKIHIYQDGWAGWISGIQLEYKDMANNFSCDPMHGSKGCRRHTLDLTHIFSGWERVQEIRFQCVEKYSKRYISMIQVKTNKRTFRQGKKEKNPVREITLTAPKGFQIYALKGSCHADEIGELASLEVSMFETEKGSSSAEAAHQTRENEGNEILAAMKSVPYDFNALSDMYRVTVSGADEVTGRQLQEEAVREHILHYRLPVYILRQKQIVFRGIYPRELSHFIEEKKTYSKAQRLKREYRPNITQEGQKGTQRAEATILRTAAVGNSSKPVSQFTSNAFEVDGYISTYAGENGLLYAYETIPYSELFGMDNKEYQCQILGGTPITALYRIETTGARRWEEYDYGKGKWEIAQKRPVNKGFQAFLHPEDQPGDHHPELANASEELCDIVSMQYNPDKVFDCQRNPVYPEAGREFTASRLDRPICFWSMSEEEIEQVHLRLKLEKDDRIGLYICKNDAPEEEGTHVTTGNIYGLGDCGFLFVGLGGGGYFFVNESLESKDQVVYIPRTGRATFRQIISYRF